MLRRRITRSNWNRTFSLMCLLLLGGFQPVCLTDAADETPLVIEPSDVSDASPEARDALEYTLTEAVLTALENNLAFQIERLRPAIRRTSEDTELATFDPSVSADLSHSRGWTSEDVQNVSGDDRTRSRATTGGVSLDQFFPTGTSAQIGLDQTFRSTDSSGNDSDRRNTNYDVSVTQSLLRGFGTEVNLARLRQARLDSVMSQYELRAAAETLVSQVEQSYWDYILNERSIEIYEKSLEIAEQQMAELNERILVGSIAETELVAGEAEIASRHESLIDARGRLETGRLSLIRLLNPDAEGKCLQRLALSDPPELDEVLLDSEEAHVAVALQQRPDLRQAELQVQRGELDLVRTRNGLLPKLDMFIALGGTTYSDSFSSSNDRDGQGWDASVGLRFQYNLGNRAELAQHRRTTLNQTQIQESLQNMEQLVQVDVRSAYVRVQVAAEKIRATEATRKLREESSRIETEKLRVGRSTEILVAQAWRDQVAAEIAEISAVIAYRKALADLYRLEGSLLERRGIVVSEAE